jgi:hypothetical protein
MVPGGLIWLDYVSLILASVLIAFGMASLNVSGVTDYAKLLIQILLLATSLLSARTLLAKKNSPFQIRWAIITVFFGLLIWLALHTIWGIYLDWNYVSTHPGSSVGIQILMISFDLLLVPVFGTVTAIIVIVSRLVAERFFQVRSDRRFLD